MTKKIALLFLTIALHFGSSNFVFSSDRIALLIGMSQYQSISILKNTLNDINLISNTLRKVGFETKIANNLTQSEIRAELAEFRIDAETAEVAIVYYAGHGVEVGGKNYLLPIDTASDGLEEVKSTSVSLDEILHSIDSARQMRIVILDSCRENPFGASGKNASIALPSVSSLGLAPPSPQRGTLVAFAAKDGKVALDGTGKTGSNSPYAAALSQHFVEQNLEIGLVFRKVRDTVLISTDNFQEPHTYGSLTGAPFFLSGNNQGANILQARERKLAWANLNLDQEKILARSAAELDTRSMIGLAYMRLNPNHPNYDPIEAKGLLEKGASAGNPEAIYELGRLFEVGIGTPQDVKKAISLYEKSASLQFSDAINDLGFLNYQGGLSVPRNKKKGLELFEQAANLGHPEAMFNFAALIDDGIVTGKTSEDAAEYLYKSVRSGESKVLEQLTLNPKMFKLRTREKLQLKLVEANFYDGKIDGDFGTKTKRGLRRAFGISE